MIPAEGTETELRLRVLADREPIQGSIGIAGGQPAAFRGWLDLLVALERASHTTGHGASPTGERSPATDRRDGG